MSRFVVGGSGITIEVEDGIAEMLERLVREAAPRTVEAIEREIDAIVEAARREWPVGREREGKEKGRPHSRDLFQVTLRIMPDLVVEAVITNTAGRGTPAGDYAYKIKRKPDGKVPWQLFVVKKVREAEGRIAEIIAEEMAAVLDGR